MDELIKLLREMIERCAKAHGAALSGNKRPAGNAFSKKNKRAHVTFANGTKTS